MSQTWSGMAKCVRLYIASIVAFIAGAGALSITYADVGVVTIDGETIPASLFRGYENAYFNRWQRCSPTSDAEVRDRLIRTWLTVQNGRKENLKLKPLTIKKLKEHKRSLISRRAQAQQNYRDKIETQALVDESSDYFSYLSFPKITNKQLQTEYNDRVAARDPKLTQVLVVQFDKVTLDSRDNEMKIFVDALSRGESWDTLVEPLEDYQRHDYYEGKWIAIPYMDNLGYLGVHRIVGDGHKLKPGDIIGPVDAVSHSHIWRIKERKILPIIQFEQALNLDDSWAKSHIKNHLRSQQWSEYDSKLRNGHDIREDGEPIIVPNRYPDCGEE